MRDPYAKRRLKTYVYADTCVIPNALGDGDRDLRAEYDLSDEDIDGIEITLRIPNTKADAAAFAEIAQTRTRITDDGAVLEQRVGSAGRDAFTTIVESWTLPGDANAANYDRLDMGWIAEWVDYCVADAWREGRGLVEKKESSSTPSSPAISPDSPELAEQSTPAV